MMSLGEAKKNVQGVLDQLRLTKPERDVLDGSLGLLYEKAVEAEEMKREMKDAQKVDATRTI